MFSLKPGIRGRLISIILFIVIVSLLTAAWYAKKSVLSVPGSSDMVFGLFGYMLTMAGLVFAVVFFMATTITKRINRIVHDIERLGTKETLSRLPCDTNDEIGVLCRAVNAMAGRMQQQVADLYEDRQKIDVSNRSLKNQIKNQIKVSKQLQENKNRLEGIVRERTVALEKEIVERKEKEAAVQDLKNMLSRIIDAMPSMIIVVDIQARITLWNQEAGAAVEEDLETARGRPVFDIFSFLEPEKAIVTKAVSEGEVQKDRKLEVVRDQQHRLFYEVTVYPLISQQIDGAVLRIDNITPRVYMEDMMIQTEKMQSIGSLAAGMAHEINNPLAGIMQNTQVMRNRIQENLPKNIEEAREIGITMEQLRQYMDKRGIFSMMDAILASGRRAADIVANMLTFSRKSESAFSSQNICDLLDRTIEIIENDYDFQNRIDFKNIRIVRDYKCGEQTVDCDAGKIQQVFFNILKNGAQAMMDTLKERKPVFTLSVYTKDPFVVIEITDNGPGMDEHVKTHIFEPFFTTKPVGVGTGLGLYVSYFIVADNHKGSINVMSTPGEGTTFTVKLPLYPGR